MSKKRKSLNTYSQGPWTLRHIAGSNFALQEFELRGAGAYPIFSKDDRPSTARHSLQAPRTPA